jgi:N-methylhydantoinase B
VIAKAAAREASPLDGVQLAVLANRFEGVVRAMRNTLVRTGRSGVINTAYDFSSCVLSREDEFLAMAESLPIHLISGPDLMAKVMKEFHPDIRRGDAFLHNSPYHGNSHAGDHSILVPVVDDDGVHRFTVLAKAHQADCGNSQPTTYFAGARDLYEEGALIFPCVKVQESYKDREDIIRMARLRIRVPDQWWGDYLALLGAARVGENKLLELGAEVGWDMLHAYCRSWLEYSEQRMISTIRKLPAGRLTVDAAHDPFPGVPEGIPLKITVEVDPERAMIEIDLRDNLDCQPCGLNLSEACARTAATTGVFNSIDSGVPANTGSFRRVNIHLRENCVVGIPRHPASCSIATTNLSDRVANAVQRAIAELGDGIGLAEVGLSQPISAAVVSGRDPRANGKPFINQLMLAMSSGGASAFADGWLGGGCVGNGGVLRQDGVEVDEIKHPIRVVAQRIIPDTEGAGRFRGGPGSYVEYGPVGCELDVVWVSDGSVGPARGARGGLDGACARQFRRSASGEPTELAPYGRLVLAPGETVMSMSCGGGGYGSPLEREPERVGRDVADGWISAERAERVYGVVVMEDGLVDRAATLTLRARLHRTGVIAP